MPQLEYAHPVTRGNVVEGSRMMLTVARWQRYFFGNEFLLWISCAKHGNKYGLIGLSQLTCLWSCSFHQTV